MVDLWQDFPSRREEPCERAREMQLQQLASKEDIQVTLGSWNMYYWVNYNELTTSSLEIIVNKGNHPQMALIQVSELL